MTDRLRLLILENNSSDVRLMLHALRQSGFDPEWRQVEAEPEYVAQLETQPDVVLADYSLPNFDALRALELLQQLQPDIPFIIVSGTIGEEAAVDAIRRGAADYVLKDRLGRLGAAVRQVLEQRRLRIANLQAEQALSENQQRTRLILETAYDPFVAIDAAGRIIDFNSQAERTFGWSRQEAVGRNLSETIVPPRHRGAHEQGMCEFLATWKGAILNHVLETTALNRDGHEFPVELIVWPIRVGETLTFTAFVRDISERKQAENQLRSLAQQLQHQNIELRRSNEELDDFAYIASHDLKEPLRGIHNYAVFLAEDYAPLLDDEGRAKLATLVRLTQRMEALINALLETSRVGRLELAFQETDLNDLVLEVLDSLRVGLETAKVEVRLPVPLPTLHCDRVRVGEVFQNLIANAMKYNDKPHKWIEIGVAPASPAADGGERMSGTGVRRQTVSLYVRDNGIGIREQHVDSIFRIFKRLNARDEFGGGTGVGLTIAKKIVERHGGGIWVESTYGEGSSFFFTLHAFGQDT